MDFIVQMGIYSFSQHFFASMIALQNTIIMNCINFSVKYDSQCGGAAGLVTANAQKSTGSAKKTICCKYKTPIFVYSKK